MSEDDIKNWVIGAFGLSLAFLGITFSCFPKYTIAYKEAVKDTYKEAYSKGFMVKEITDDDKVIYKWKESH